MNYKESIQTITVIFFLIFIFLATISDRLLILSFDFWLLTLVIFLSLSKHLKFLRVNHSLLPIVILMLILYTSGAVSLVYTKNLENGLLILEHRLMLLIIPLLLLLRIYEIIPKSYALKSFLFGVLFSLLYILIRAVIAIKSDFGSLASLAATPVLFFQEQFGLVRHRTYTGMFGLVVINSILFFIYRGNLSIKLKIGYNISILLIIASILIQGSRIIEFLLCISFLVWLIKFTVIFWKKLNIPASLSATIILLLGVCLFFLITFLYKKIPFQSIGTDEQRIAIWQNAWALIRQNWIFGLGIGDVKDHLSSSYLDVGLVNIYKASLNCHNQFFEFWLESGMITILSYAGILMVMFFNKWDRKKNYAILLLISMFFIVGLVESYLNRIAGVYIFTIIPFLYLLDDSGKTIYRISFVNRNRDKLEHIYNWSILILSSVILIFVFVFALFRPKFNPQDPATFATKSSIYSSMYISDSLNLPQKTNAVIYCQEQYLESSTEGGSFYDLISTKVKKKEDTIIVSIQCFVETKEFNGRVGIAVGNKDNSYEYCFYQLSEKGVWQNLTIKTVKGRGMQNVVIFMDRFKTNGLFGQACVHFAYPQIYIIESK